MLLGYLAEEGAAGPPLYNGKPNDGSLPNNNAGTSPPQGSTAATGATTVQDDTASTSPAQGGSPTQTTPQTNSQNTLGAVIVTVTDPNNGLVIQKSSANAVSPFGMLLRVIVLVAMSYVSARF
jgi:hypothetical protein